MKNNDPNKPSAKTIETLFNESANRNSNLDHYKLVMKVNNMQMNQTDCSFMIDKLREKNEWNHPVLKLVSSHIREINKIISINPIRWKNQYDKKNKQIDYTDKVMLEKFKDCINKGKFKEAIIPYMNLADNNKFKEAIAKNVTNEKMKNFLAVYSIEDIKATKFMERMKENLMRKLNG